MEKLDSFLSIISEVEGVHSVGFTGHGKPQVHMKKEVFLERYSNKIFEVANRNCESYPWELRVEESGVTIIALTDSLLEVEECMKR